MSTRDKILKAGREEFLGRGFTDASMREIAKRAHVTTGAIYGYYTDKNALFKALVEPEASVFKGKFFTVRDDFEDLAEEEQIETIRSGSNQILQDLLDYIYGNFDAFKLLVSKSAGSEYSEFIEELAEVEADSTQSFLAVLKNHGHETQPLTDNLTHILARAYFSAIFETVDHDMSKEEADNYVSTISAFFFAGWRELLKL